MSETLVRICNITSSFFVFQDDADSGYSGSGGSAGFTLTKEEICSKIKAYNENLGTSSGTMTLVG